MNEQERDDIYCDVQDRQWLDLRCCESEPWVLLPDGNWKRNNISGTMEIIVTPEGVVVQNDEGHYELHKR